MDRAVQIAAVRRAATGQRHVVDHADRDGCFDSPGFDERDLPERIRTTQSAGHSQAISGAAGGDPDDRLWLLRRHVYSARSAETHFPGKWTIQCPGGRDRRGHHDYTAGRLTK